MSVPFSTETLGTFVAMAAPLLGLVGVDTRNITMEKAEDFAAIERLGIELAELGAVGKEKLGDGSIDPGDLSAIFAEAADIPAVAKALALELKDQKLGTPRGDTPTDPPEDDHPTES